MNDDCIFCKIAAKTVPSNMVYEDDKFFGFLSRGPVSKGHTLLIPKDHYVWMQDLPDDLLSQSFLITKKIMKVIKKSFGCDYVQIWISGEEIPHFHIHLFARWFNDGVVDFKHVEYETELEKEEYANKIKNSL